MSHTFGPIMGIPTEAAIEAIVSVIRCKSQMDSPIYKLWFRKENPIAGQALWIRKVEEKGETSAEQLDELREQLPEIAAVVGGVCDKERERLAAMDELELRGALQAAVGQQEMGSYMLHPSIFHKGSDAFVRRCFPLAASPSSDADGESNEGSDESRALRGGLTLGHLLHELPLCDWDFGIKHFVRGYSLDVTAHADYAGSETPLGEILDNVRAKSFALPEVPAEAYSTADEFLGTYMQLVPRCLGGVAADSSIPLAADPLRRGWATAVAYAAAVGLHEQNLNGGWDQVKQNICRAGGEAFHDDVLLYALSGLLLAGDLISAKRLIHNCIVDDSEPADPRISEAEQEACKKVVAAFTETKAFSVGGYPPRSDAEEFKEQDFVHDDASLLRVRWLLGDVLLGSGLAKVKDASPSDGAEAGTRTRLDAADDATCSLCIVHAFGTALQGI